ncbi:ferredoxin [Kitasatospora sp. NPDC015120]|uniref:ferredoxin n=1 Tax=Kitasatospora sp. NPDC015120 TaxID=3364023 RepID=UPI0036F4AC77
MSGDGTAGTAPEVIVQVDRDRCIGSGMCALTAPGSLALGADGLARPLREQPTGAGGEPLTPELADAVEYCPVEALALYGARDGRRIDPVG